MLDRYEAESEKHFGYFPWGPMGIPLHTRGGLKKDRDPSMYNVHTLYIQDGMKKKEPELWGFLSYSMANQTLGNFLHPFFIHFRLLMYELSS